MLVRHKAQPSDRHEEHVYAATRSRDREVWLSTKVPVIKGDSGPISMPQMPESSSGLSCINTLLIHDTKRWFHFNVFNLADIASLFS